ncbi:hypothetical protein ACHAWO_000896 [Cyclotella atomus]|uniref:Uncharacterized protein n=1 Tax=Cyclotella atomus TaxID=382360 RepID=A0ABD3PYC2_9STRA
MSLLVQYKAVELLDPQYVVRFNFPTEAKIVEYVIRSRESSPLTVKWRPIGYNHKKQHKKKLHHKRRNGHRNHWGRDLVGKNFDAANEVAVEEEVHDPSGK